MNQFSYDVGLENFATGVLQASQDVPVLVDFWAPWCQPCQALGPLLEKLAAEYGGRFLLARVDADNNPEIAQQFGVRSIPTVKVVFQGRLLDEFTGALPEAELRAFIDRLAPSPAEPLYAEAMALAAQGSHAEALALLEEAVELDPASETARIACAEMLFELGRHDEARAGLAAGFSQEEARAAALAKRLDLASQAIDTAPLDARLAANADDHAARLERARALASAGRYDAALADAFAVVQRDRFYDEGAGRKLMLEFFAMLESSEQYDPLVRQYRRALSALLN